MSSIFFKKRNFLKNRTKSKRTAQFSPCGSFFMQLELQAFQLKRDNRILFSSNERQILVAFHVQNESYQSGGILITNIVNIARALIAVCVPQSLIAQLYNASQILVQCYSVSDVYNTVQIYVTDVICIRINCSCATSSSGFAACSCGCYSSCCGSCSVRISCSSSRRLCGFIVYIRSFVLQEGCDPHPQRRQCSGFLNTVSRHRL